MRIPTLKRPRFSLANRAAISVLKELHYPEPPIPIEKYLEIKSWKIIREELGGPDGAMLKMTYRKHSKFFIYLATDMDPDSPYDEETVHRRQIFTLAHELGHILLHSSFIVDSRDTSFLSNETAKIMEQEANWFASRLLMPNYAFKNITDLLPDQIADKCKVNLTPANIRVNRLTPNIKKTLIDSARLDKWPPLEDFNIPGYPKEKRFESWESYQEAAASSQLLYMCSQCHLLHNEDSIAVWGRECSECGGKLINTNIVV